MDTNDENEDLVELLELAFAKENARGFGDAMQRLAEEDEAGDEAGPAVSELVHILKTFVTHHRELMRSWVQQHNAALMPQFDRFCEWMDKLSDRDYEGA